MVLGLGIEHLGCVRKNDYKQRCVNKKKNNLEKGKGTVKIKEKENSKKNNKYIKMRKKNLPSPVLIC